VVAVVTNAIQASPAQSPVEVILGREGQMARIEVSDRGVGVAPELRERIFQPYFTSKPDGTGIGLALAKHVIQQHRGQISVRDRDSALPGPASTNRGAVFRILLPSGFE